MTEVSDTTRAFERNVERLRELMSEHGLSRRQTADFLGWPQTTLDSYLVPEGRPLHRRMPNAKRQLMDFHFLTRQMDLQNIKKAGAPARSATN